MMKEHHGRLLNKREMADYLGVKIFTIDAWVAQRHIPFIKLLGRCVRFGLSEIEAWLARQKVEPMSAPF